MIAILYGKGLVYGQILQIQMLPGPFENAMEIILDDF